MSRNAYILLVGVVLVIIVGAIVVMSRARNNTEDVDMNSETSSETTDDTFVETATPETTATSSTSGTSSTTTPSLATTPAQSVDIITFTDNGFSHTSLTIPVGGTVRFVNNSSTNFWPASDPHPSHTGLAGFDAKKALKPGEEFSFTFTKAGTFGFHDHLDSTNKGTIIVK